MSLIDVTDVSIMNTMQSVTSSMSSFLALKVDLIRKTN